jgi:LuxR family transcriptional regulator, quorum-sensing system regulator BjaR1
VPAIRDAFELLPTLQSATTRDDLIDQLSAATARFGYAAIAIVQFAPPEGDGRPSLVAARMAADLAQVFGTLRPSDMLHVVMQAADRPVPLAEALAASSAAKVLADAGLNDGLAIPVRLPDGKRGVAVLLGESLAREESDELALVALVQTAVAQLGHLTPEASAAAMLTPREREVLRWTAAGKTADASASILGISVRTVEYHLLNAARKLNTANRTHTVVEALRSRQISL